MQQFTIEKPYYPIVYVRGYAMRASDRDETFNDTYYGFSATSVEKRNAPPPQYYEADVFEGQLIRFMKIKDYGYADAVNRGLEVFYGNPSRSLWVSRFYDQDVFRDRVRRIEEHAEDLRQLVCETIPERLRASGLDLGEDDQHYKVMLIAHSMGGLVCRTLIQNLLPARGQDPKRWIYRLVTMGTPHRGIDLGRIPDAMEDFVTSRLNPNDANIFNPPRMREYLKLPERYEAHSLGDPAGPYAFPVKRCLCIIGSDHQSYNATRELTGNVSDGLVKQDHAYLVAGEPPAEGTHYPDDRRAYWANVHRAHSGRRGIVNSYESYENIERFLFGNVRAHILLDQFTIQTPVEPNSQYFYDVEFLLSIRNTAVYLHRREQEPCENAMRLDRDAVPSRLFLHTAFLNAARRDAGSNFSHFAAKLRVVEHRIQGRRLAFDIEYPDRPIFDETVEVRIGDVDGDGKVDVGYRWLSDAGDWQALTSDGNGVFRFPLRAAGAVSAEVVIQASPWPDLAETHDDVP
jgi:hypothetical protein